MKDLRFLISIVLALGMNGVFSQDHATPGAGVLPVSKRIRDIEGAMTVRKNDQVLKAINNEGAELTFTCLNYTLPEKTEIITAELNKNHDEILILGIAAGTRVPNRITYILDYDLSSDQLTWGKQSVYGNGIGLMQTDKFFIYRIDREKYWENFALSKETGQLYWLNEYELREPIPDKGIAFTGTVNCVDLSTGELKWERKIRHDFGWLEDQVIGNTVYSLIDGVHSIDLDNGSGWDLQATTGKSDPNDYVGQIISASVLNTMLFTSGAWHYIPIYIPTAIPQGIKVEKNASHSVNYSNAISRTGLASNLKIVGDRIYFSAKDRLLCVDLRNGQKIWEAKLDPSSGAAFIELIGDRLLFINRGCGYKDKAFQSYFIPYFMFFDASTGKPLNVMNIKVHHNSIMDFQVNDTNLILMAQKDVYRYSTNCKLISKLSKSPDSTLRMKRGAFQLLLKEQALDELFTLPQDNPSEFITLAKLSEQGIEYFLLTDSGIAGFDPDMHLLQWWPLKDLYVRLGKSGGRCIFGSLKSDQHTRFLSEGSDKEKILLRIEPGCRSEVQNDCLVFYPDLRSISFIPLSELIPSE